MATRIWSNDAGIPINATNLNGMETDISAAQADATRALDNILDARLDIAQDIAEEVAALDADIAGLLSTGTSQGASITSIKAKNTEQDTRLTSVESKNTTQDSRLQSVESKNITQDSRITAVEVMAGVAPGSVTDASVASLILNASSQSRVEMDKQFVRKGAFGIRAEDWGCKGDYVSTANKGTDNADPLDALYIAAKNAAVFGAVCMEFGGGAFRTTREWNIYRPNAPRLDIVIKGQSNLTTFLISDFFGADKALIKAHDPSGITRCSPTSIMHIQLATATRTGGTNPMLLDIYGHGESRLESIRFGPSNNTVMSIGALQNVRYRDLVSFYGGKHYSYRDTTGITFSITSGTNILTASADIFTGADTGRIINLFGSTTVKYLISTFTDARTVQISATTPATTTQAAVGGVFEPARITTVAGSNQVSANASVFTNDDIGRVIYIVGAKAGPWGDSLLRGKIQTLVSSQTVTLDVTADIALTRTEFGVPVIDLYAPDKVDQLGTLLGGNNDFKIDLLHVENYSGIGLVSQNSVFGHITNLKFHGEHAPTNTSSSLAAMWLDDFAGVISGELDGQATGDHRVWLGNMNDLLTFEWLATRRMVNERIFEVGAMTDPGGIAEVRSFVSYTAPTTGDPYELVQDTNTSPRLLFLGLVNMLGDTKLSRFYVGHDTYFLPDGSMVNGPTTSAGLFAAILSGQSGARLLFEDYATKKFSLGNAAGGGTAFTLTDETANQVRLLINTTGSILPGADNTQPLGSTTSRWSEVVATRFVLGSTGIVIVTGTGSPEGVVTGAPGSEYKQIGGAVGQLQWGKKTGTGNTGWAPIW